MLGEDGKYHWAFNNNQCDITQAIKSDRFRLENVAQMGSLMGWIVSTEDGKGGCKYWSICVSFGGGLYCDMASDEDIEAFPTALYNLVLFQ